ncbi:MAG: putative Ig domain-containing protein [Chloroflexota bacterium]
MLKRALYILIAFFVAVAVLSPARSALAGSANIILDGGFEKGSPWPDWGGSSLFGGKPLCGPGLCAHDGSDMVGPHNGSNNYAWFGGVVNSIEDATVSQSVVIPNGGTVHLDFVLWWGNGGATTTTFTVEVDGTTKFTLDGTGRAPYAAGYAAVPTVDLSTYADGAAHTIVFHETNAAGPVENISMDDVKLTTTIDVAPVFTSAPPSGGRLTIAYHHTFTANGTTPITFTVTTGVLPDGLTLDNATGVVTGTPTVMGTFTGTVTAANGVVPDATQNFSIDILAAPVPAAITSAAPAAGQIGVPYTHTYVVTGTAPITFNVNTGALPDGLTLSPTTGVISGTPTALGTFTGQVHATNGYLPDTAYQPFNITITKVPPTITSAAPAGGSVNVVYTHTYVVTGTGPFTFSVSAGALPDGLTLDTSTGVISGTPTAAATFNGTVTVTNGQAPDATQNFSIIIGAAPVAPTITSAAPAGGTVGVIYTHNYTATGTAPITFAVASGTLPTGLTLNATTGVLSGTPTAAGTFTGSVSASNGTLPNATQNFSIIIAPAPVAPTITSSAPAGGTVGVAYTHTYTATGTAPITFAVASGALPGGLTLNTTTGVLSGTPTTAGTFTGSVRASNGTLPNATQNFSIIIAPAVTHLRDYIGVFRPSTATFYMRNSNTTGSANITTALGASTDLPVVGDWNGDGIDTVGVFRPSTAQFFLRDSNTPGAPIVYTFTLGAPGDLPMAGDWNNNGKDGVGVFRPSNGLIYLKNNLTTGFADFQMVLGLPGDMPVAGDWNNDGKDSPGVYRPSSATFFLTNAVANGSATANYTATLGVAGDAPIAGDWNNNGSVGIGVFRPSNGLIYLKNVPTTGFADISIVFGIPNDKPVAGHWFAGPPIPPPTEPPAPKLAPTFVP